MFKELVTKRISKQRFHRKIKSLNQETKEDILDYIFYNRDWIDHFEYGCVPGKRIYIIVLDDQTEKVWVTNKIE